MKSKIINLKIDIFYFRILFQEFNQKMSIKPQLNSIPPEIWNRILFFTEHQDLELIRFLMYHQLTFNLSLDAPKIKEFYLRNIKPISKVFIPLMEIKSIILLEYSTIYPSSMISKNIKAIE